MFMNRIFAGAVGALAVGAGLVLWVLFSSVVPNDGRDLAEFDIRSGQSFSSIVSSLSAKKLIDGQLRLNLAGRMIRVRRSMKAGKYEIEPGLSSYRLLRKLSRGKVASVRVTVPEGYQARQIASVMRRKIGVDSLRFMTLVDSAEFAADVGIEAPGLEGFLFPNTYQLSWGMSAERVIRILVAEFNKQFSDSMRAVAAEGEFSLHELVTLASIIEGEAMIDAERPTISAVYRNRLKRRMRLQADPTIQYIVSDGPRRLVKKDLAIDSPYNTYKYSGLPPGPINNPGLASLIAAFSPADVSYLYFVANGAGAHTFTRTHREHLRAKARFDQHRRKVQREKNKSGK